MFLYKTHFYQLKNILQATQIIVVPYEIRSQKYVVQYVSSNWRKMPFIIFLLSHTCFEDLPVIASEKNA